MEIHEVFENLYFPKCAVVVYQRERADYFSQRETYAEYFDMDENGSPCNARPLSAGEAQRLSQALDTRKQKDKAFLKAQGILPKKVLRLDPSENGSVLWYTQAGVRMLYFCENLGIPCAKAHVPPLLWLADKDRLKIFALKSDRRPAENTPLYHAPFFNIYQDGRVCMGTTSVPISKYASLEEFIATWEAGFFNSYFSHLNHPAPAKENCVTLWKRLVHTQEPFPKNTLIKTRKTLKELFNEQGNNA